MEIPEGGKTGVQLALLGADGDHEAIVAQGDVVFAGFGVTRAQNLLQRFLDCAARVGDAGSNTAQSGRGVVADISVGQDGAANSDEQITKIAQRSGAFGEQRKFQGLFAELRLEPAGDFKQRCRFEKLFRFEHGTRARDAIEPPLRVS